MIGEISVFEIEFDQFLPHKLVLLCVRLTWMPKVFSEIAPVKILPQLGVTDLLESEMQWQRFGCPADLDAVLGQVAKQNETR